MPRERETDATLVRRTMNTLDLSERGMAALMDVTQPTVNGVLNGSQFLKLPARQFILGLLVERAATERLARGQVTTSNACRTAARAGEGVFVEHARECAYCIARAYMALPGVAT